MCRSSLKSPHQATRNRFNAGLYRALRESPGLVAASPGRSSSRAIGADQARWHHRCEMIGESAPPWQGPRCVTRQHGLDPRRQR